MSDAGDLARNLISELTDRGLSIAVAESLTGGLLVSTLIGPAGASAVVYGGVVAYNTELKHTLLGVDAELLSEFGPVHPKVAEQLAEGVRQKLAVGGKAADIGISTTGVAGPDSQGGIAPGRVYLGLSRGPRCGNRVESKEFNLLGTRDDIRNAAVHSALEWLTSALNVNSVEQRE